MLNNITVVLNETWHPGNIGSALRAMKTMGLTRLTVVKPRLWPHPDVNTMAAGAEDLVPSVRICQSLEEAIADAQLVVATSARIRGFKWPQRTARECAYQITEEAKLGHQVALVFGQEKTGLRNDQLQLCNLHTIIPSNPDYGVLNVASAVQILSYEIWLASIDRSESKHQSKATDNHSQSLPDNSDLYPRQQELAYFYRNLEYTLKAINFIIAQHPGEIMVKLQRLFNRARPEQSELNILQGILSRINQMSTKVPTDQLPKKK